MKLKDESVMVILSSPSGAGKTTITKKIQQKYQNFKISVSHTTRAPRPNEVEGVDYFFVNNNEFNELVKKDKFYEHAKIFDNYYGTSKKSVEDIVKNNSIIIGNLPYNISSQILAKLIKFKKWLPKYKKLILMFQKEVADKILAKYKSSEFGRLAVLTNSRLKVTNSFNVSENCFYPTPKVKSTILVFEPFINKDFKVKEITNLEIITQVFFSKKRKMINKAFKTLFKKPSLVAERINIDLNLRPNKISESEYYKITEYFEKEL